MKVKFNDFIKKLDTSVLVAMAIFKDLQRKHLSKRISEIAETTSGGTPLRNNPEYYNGNIAWLKSGELNEGIITKSEETITEEGLKNSSAKLFPKGTLLIALYGATTGKTGILDIEASTNQAVCAVFPNKEVDRDFLFWFFRQHRYEYIRISKGGAQPNISQTVINNSQIPLPNIEEQKKISQLLFQIEKEKKVNEKLIGQAFLNGAKRLLNLRQDSDQLLTELNHQLALVKQLRQAYLREAMQGKLVPQDEADEPANILLEKIKAEKERLIKEKKIKKEKPLPPIKSEEIPFEIPRNWTWCRLGDITLSSFYGPRFSNSDYVQDGLPTIRTTDMTDDGKIELKNTPRVSIKDKKKLELYKVLDGDLLVTRSGSIGIMAVFHGNYLAIPSAYLIRFRFSHNMLPEYVFYLFKSSFWQFLMGLSARATAQVNVNATNLLNLPIVLAPLAEQKRIVAKLEKLMKFCDELETNIKQGITNADLLLQVALKEALAE